MPDPAAPELDAEAARKAAHKQQASPESDKARPATTMTEEEKVAYMLSRSKLAQRGDMFARKPYSAAAVNDMVRRKDQEALRQTGSTSGIRTAQAIGDAGHKVDSAIEEHGDLAKKADKMLPGPILETVQAAALAADASGTIAAKDDPERQKKARETKAAAAQAHSEGHDLLTSLRDTSSTVEDKTVFEKGRALAAFRGAGETVRAHNLARRAAITAGKDTIKPMSVDHTTGEAVPIKVDDGTVIDATLADRAREQKDARKEELATEKASLKSTAHDRLAGGDAEWDARMASNATEKAGLKSENAAMAASQKERRALDAVDLRKGYRYALHDDEQQEYHAARAIHQTASDNISAKHDEHVSGLQTSFDELNALGLRQKEADRAGRPRRSVTKAAAFSKKAELEGHEADVEKMRTKQTQAIDAKVTSLKSELDRAQGSTGFMSRMFGTARPATASPVEIQRLQDQIAHHERLSKQSVSDKSFVSTEFLSEEDQSALHDSMNKAGTLRREKETGLTEEQQRQHDALRTQLDAAKANADSGADQADITARDAHQGTVEKYRFVKTHGLTPEEHDAKLENEQRLLAIKQESKTGLTTDESNRLAAIAKERSDMKGLVKRTRAFATKHEGETVWQGRAGGVGTSYREDRAETSDADALAAKVNSGAKTAHRVGEVMEANLDKGRKAMEEGDHEHARNIGMSRAVQNIADMASSAAGGPAIGAPVQTGGKVLQGGADILGGATHDAADRASFAKHARAMTVGADGKTDQWHNVHDGVIDFHGAEDVPFEGGIKKGARQLLSVAKDEFGDDLKEAASDTVANSSVTKTLAEHASSLAAPVVAVGSDVAHNVVDHMESGAHAALGGVQGALGSAAEHVGGGVSDALGGAHEMLGGAAEQAQGLGDHVESGLDQVRGVIGDSSESVRGAIDEHAAALPGQVHDAVIEQASSKAGDVVDAGFDKADAALQDAPKEQEIIGAPIAPRTDVAGPDSHADPTPAVEPTTPDPIVDPAIPGPTPAPSPTIEHDLDADRPPAPPSPMPAPAKQRLPWWKRMWNAVKRGARSVGRGMRRVGNSIRRGVSAAGKWFRGLFS